jgi:hypothetical protein
MPAVKNHTGVNGVPGGCRAVVRGFLNGETPSFEYPYGLTGVTKDSTGAPLAAVTVQLVRTADQSPVHRTTSDANGVYVIAASQVLQHYLVAYKPGVPDVAGTSVNTLVGV